MSQTKRSNKFGAGTYWVIRHSGIPEVMTVGRAIEACGATSAEQIEEYNAIGYVFGRWYNTDNPNGEIGVNNVTVPWAEKITGPQFDILLAKIRGKKADLDDQLSDWPGCPPADQGCVGDCAQCQEEVSAL